MKINILKSKVLCLTLLCILCLSLDVKSEAADIIVRVLVDKAEIHLRATSESPVVGSVPMGANLESDRLFGEWYRVKLPPNEEGFVVIGYIHKDLVEAVGETKEFQEIPENQKERPQQAPPEERFFPIQNENARTGFFLRGALGYGPAVNMNSDELRFKISGGGVGGVISLGSFLNERLLIYGEAGGYTISNPKMTYLGYTITSSGTSATMSSIGAGLGYYLVPNSVYAGFTLSLSLLTTEASGDKGSTDPGIGFSFQIGKDFPISQKVLLGVAGQASFSTMKDKNDGARWNASAFGIMMTISWATKGWQ